MKTRNSALSLASLSVLTLILGNGVFADQPPDNVEGNWTIYSTSLKNGETVLKHVQIAQYGNRITGYFEGPDQSGPIQGEVKGHHIEFNTVTRTVIHFRGQIYGNNISGLYGIKGQHAPWQAVRPATAVVAPAPPANGIVYTSQPVLTPPVPGPPVAYSLPPAPAGPVPAAPAPIAQNSSPVPAPLSPDQLDALVAPIALYPDSLVAQVLAGATFPQDVSAADEWLHQNLNLTGLALAQAVDQQSWDPSVKALTQFPSVLDNLAKNLAWTSSLGQAFHFQQSDVMAAVQVMRGKAKAAGTLQSSSQITITQPAPNTIVIQPVNPQVVYVPQYNPAIVFGTPLVVPLYQPPVFFATASVTFGAGISIGGFCGGGTVVAGGGFGWGFHSWGLNWGSGGGGNTIIYNHNTYITNNTWRSNTTNNYNGYHAWAGGVAGTQNHASYGPDGGFHPNANYHPGVDTHYGPNGAYHPNEYFGPSGAIHRDVPGTGPANMPNGGNNGDHGLIGGNGGVQRAGEANPERSNSGWDQNRDGNQNRFAGAQQNRSRFSGDGAGNRFESNRGRGSMAGRRAQRMGGERARAENHFSGGGRRR